MVPYTIRFATALLLTSASLVAADTTTSTSNANAQQDEANLAAFRQEMQIELQKAQIQVQDLQARATDRSHAPQSIDKVALANSIMMLDVKTSLVNNFTNNPVIRSPQVRNLLISILRKDLIMEGDLTALQNAANQERAREKQQ
ncbi:MAG: hypothetical protein H0X51_02265 [Parachlamydiaceae bacterium]|nr:hypothetical protein [Parachlamydiaceae bacterium]